MRANVFISSTGHCSRRAADKLIEEGRVLVNGEQAKIGMDITIQDEVMIDGVLLREKPQEIYILYNKPRGIETTTDQKKEKNIIDEINYPERIFPIGRLDKDSSGLIMLTNNGNIVNKILRSENHHEKEYLVSVDRDVTEDFMIQMAKGVSIYNPVQHRMQMTKPAICKKIGKRQFSIILTEGLNLQIRRMSKALGYRVLSLDRTRLLIFTKENISLGNYRLLSKKEITDLMDAIENVSS